MGRRVLVPTEEAKGMESRLSPHFGRAPYFALVEFDEEKRVSRVEFLPNTGEHFGGKGHAHDWVFSLRPDALVVSGIGPGALERAKSLGVPVLRGKEETLGDILTAYTEGNLEELTEGCHTGHRCHREGDRE